MKVDDEQIQLGHRLFAAQTYNEAADILWNNASTPEQLGHTIDLAHASRYHWRFRADKTPIKDAIALTQLAWAYVRNGRAELAKTYALDALRTLEGTGAEASYYGYAHASLAMAEAQLGNHGAAAKHLAEAEARATSLSDAQDKAYFEQHLEHARSVMRDARG